MRRFLLVAAMLGVASGARAADMPDFLRGSFPAVQNPPTRNWDGWYVGGQGGYSTANGNLSQSLTGETNFIYRNSVLEAPTSQLSALNNANTQNVSYGAFVGRNYQWDDIVLGIEGNYNHFNNLKAASASSVGPLNYNFQDSTDVSTTYSVTIGGNASVQIKDAITMRGRAGWATGNFLPYAFGGVAFGLMDVERNVRTNTTGQDFTSSTDAFGNVTVTAGTPYQVAAATTPAAGITQGKSNAFAFGWTGGLGAEYAVWGNLFLRGEWEYIKFMSVMNTSVTMNGFHAGIGYRF